LRAEHGAGGLLLLDALRPAGAVEVGGLAKAALAVGEVYDVQIVFAEVGKPEGEPGAAAEVIGVGADNGDRLAPAVISCVHLLVIVQGGRNCHATAPIAMRKAR